VYRSLRHHVGRGPIGAVAAIAVIALLVAASVGIAAPARASVAQGLVAATTSWLSDDWADEGEVAQNNHALSGATGLWQAVLWADGAIEQDGTRFDAGDIDCQFGPNTAAATRNWQAVRGGLTVDGRAGRNTWTAAGGQLRLHSMVAEGTWNVEYVGRYAGRTFTAVRNAVNGGQYSGWYWTTSWPNWPNFRYDSRPAGCSGVPRGYQV
jgi:hypothetical protein